MAPLDSSAAVIGCGGNWDRHGSVLNREVAATLTECTVFIFTRRAWERLPLQMQLNGPIYWQGCVEMWRIEGKDAKECRNKSLKKKKKKAELRCKRVAVADNHNPTQPDAGVTVDNAFFPLSHAPQRAADVNADFISDFRKMKIDFNSLLSRNSDFDLQKNKK